MLIALTLTAGVLMAAQHPYTDFAESRQLDAWLHHPVYGDPSFDAFERLPGNPIHRGAPPYEWPVNGSLFEDPVSGDWFCYVGEYSKGYDMNPEHLMRCTAYRSSDKGRTWTRLGGVFSEVPQTLDGDAGPVGHAPDVSVVYDRGRYHMIFDYVVANATWQSLTQVEPPSGNGVAYAWADGPEGPFHIAPKPVYRTGDHPNYFGKYRRGYAASLVRRPNDWMVLMMLDSGPYFGWALIGLTAANPEGPYSEPVFLRTVEDGYYHPPLLEFFPAFARNGRVYAPATSVAMNRNYQALFSAKLEDAMDPRAWSADHYGSVWHAEDVENEYYGIWGQTLAAMPIGKNKLFVMFPSRDKDGMGTINIAARDWDRPYRARGFVMSGHNTPAISLLDGGYASFELDARLHVRGTAAILWHHNGPLGPDKVAADAGLHPLTTTDTSMLELSPGKWTLAQVNAAGQRAEVASAPLPPDAGRFRLSLDGNTLALRINSEKAWSGEWPGNGNGAVGLLVAPHSHLEVEHFSLRPGPSDHARAESFRSYLYTDALLGAAQSSAQWTAVTADPSFSYGCGAVSNAGSARAKWNVRCKAFRVCAPRASEYGVADIAVDGVKVGAIDFRADAPQSSQAVFTHEGLTPGYHAITLTVQSGRIPLDILDATE